MSLKQGPPSILQHFLFWIQILQILSSSSIVSHPPSIVPLGVIPPTFAGFSFVHQHPWFNRLFQDSVSRKVDKTAWAPDFWRLNGIETSWSRVPSSIFWDETVFENEVKNEVWVKAVRIALCAARMMRRNEVRYQILMFIKWVTLKIQFVMKKLDFDEIQFGGWIGVLQNIKVVSFHK